MNRDELLSNICPTDTTFDCWNGDKSCNCDDCNRVLEEWLYDYEKHVIEQYKADTNLKDTIRGIHDNVAQEMYYKGIDDLCNEISTYRMYDEYGNVIDEFARKLYEGCNEMIETCGSNTAPISWAEAYADFKVDIEEIAEQLKERKE